MFKLVSSRTLPFWWDDVSDFSTLEALAVQSFNHVGEYTCGTNKFGQMVKRKLCLVFY